MTIYVEVVDRRVKVTAVAGSARGKLKLNTDRILVCAEIGIRNAS